MWIWLFKVMGVLSQDLISDPLTLLLLTNWSLVKVDPNELKSKQHME